MFCRMWAWEGSSHDTESYGAVKWKLLKVAFLPKSRVSMIGTRVKAALRVVKPNCASRMAPTVNR